jgi:uncharacterized protein (DUF362 family)
MIRSNVMTIGRVLIAVLALTGVAAGGDFTVGVAPSDDPVLAAPVARDKELSSDQIADMVRRAVDLAGGMAAVVPADAKLVALKPNIVMPTTSGSGVITDARVVRGVALLVHEVAPRARIVIAEGAGAWADPAFRDSFDVRAGWEDGFAGAGYRDVVVELRGKGIDIVCRDINFDKTYTLTVPGGGLARPDYDIAVTLIDADVLINCPVAKTHGAKITACMKNQFGMLPGLVYGWGKSSGTKEHTGIPHTPRILDEAFVDLAMVTGIDFNVVDMIAGAEGGAFQEVPKRSNMIVAGADPIATDLVVARLMGFNPDDMEFADVGWQRGIGPRWIDNVEIRGGRDGRIDELVSRFMKAGGDYGFQGAWGEWGEQANYGKGPRHWLLKDPLPRDHAFAPEEIAELAPLPGSDGWSKVVWFGHDKIDLDKYFKDPYDCAVYAFTRFRMSQSDSVRFWVGSDEGMKVWIDGELIYDHKGRRRHRLGSVKFPGYLEAGEHSLLVRAEQTRGSFDFSFNVCEPIDDELYAGNRYPSLRYYPAPGYEEGGVMVGSEDEFSTFFEAYVVSTLKAGDLRAAGASASDSLTVERELALKSGDLLDVLAEIAGKGRADVDSADLALLSQIPFGFTSYGFGKEGRAQEYGPEIDRLLKWFGYRYYVSHGQRRRESLADIKGWLALGKVPVVGVDEQWFPITGYRERGGKVELRIVSPDGVEWGDLGGGDWWAKLPGDVERNTPFVVVEQESGGLSADALVDSVAALAMELALVPWVDNEDPEPWGVRGSPAGVAAWDAYVISWERQPWTAEWLQELGWTLRRVQRFMPWLAQRAELSAHFFERAAERTGKNKRQKLLRETAVGYRAEADALRRIEDGLPGRDAEEADMAEVGKLRPLLREARQGERQALTALSKLVGGPSLPKMAEDPMQLRDRGVKLAVWKAARNRGLFRLTLGPEGKLQQELLMGTPGVDIEGEVLAEVPQKKGWTMVIEEIKARGVYQVRQQPSAENGWQGVVRVDDVMAGRGNEFTHIALWALPLE